MTEAALVLFDGDCNLCAATVSFITAHEQPGRFRLASLHSTDGAQALARFKRRPDAAASLILIDDAGLHDRSSAAIRIARGLRPPWRWLAVFGAVPAAMRDPVYVWVARNRYRWFGRRGG